MTTNVRLELTIGGGFTRHSHCLPHRSWTLQRSQPPTDPPPHGGFQVTRWRRFGHDRLYVKSCDGGIDIGWVDLRSGKSTLHDPVHARAFAAAVTTYCRAHDISGPNGGPIPSTQPADVAAEAAEWLASRAAPQPLDDYYVKIDWRDTARNRPGERAAQQATAHRAQAPVRTLFARVAGAHTDERAWRIGAQGEELVARELARLPAGWKVLHAVEVGSRGADVDHVVIGPTGVFTINAKHHPQAKIWVGGHTVLVNGRRHPYVRNSRHEAKRAARLLTASAGFPVDVHGVIAVVNAAKITVKRQPDDVHVLTHRELQRWLGSRRPSLSDDAVDHLYRVARKSTTWTS